MNGANDAPAIQTNGSSNWVSKVPVNYELNKKKKFWVSLQILNSRFISKCPRGENFNIHHLSSCNKSCFYHDEA